MEQILGPWAAYEAVVSENQPGADGKVKLLERIADETATPEERLLAAEQEAVDRALVAAALDAIGQAGDDLRSVLADTSHRAGGVANVRSALRRLEREHPGAHRKLMWTIGSVKS